MDVAVIYCRKSAVSALPTDVSFDIQQSECEKYAAEKGYRVGRIFKESHSGADLVGRPLIWEAIEEVRTGKAQVLLVRNFDRLARKPEHQGVILYEVEEKAGGRVEAALEQYDADDTMAKTMRNIMAVVAEAERLNAVARMERGKKYRAERGHLMGASNPLFGYAWLDDVAGERTTYVEDPETGAIVRRIYKLATTGHSLHAIARTLNAEGVPTPSQWAERTGHIGRRTVGSTWHPATVRRVIDERTYTGDGAAYRYRWTRKDGKYLRVVRPETERVALKVPALVDLATFNAANAAIGAKETNGRPPTDREATWLRLHVYCGVCGSRCVIRRRNDDGTYRYYCGRCRGRTVGGESCPGGDFNIRAHKLDPYAYSALTALSDSPVTTLRERLIQRLGFDRRAVLVSMAEGFEAQLAEKRAELETARRRARQTQDDVLAQQFMQDAVELNAAITALEAEYREARNAAEDFSSGIAWVDATLERIKAGLPGQNPTADDIRALPYEERRLLLAATGLYLNVYPTGYRDDGERVKASYHWHVDPVIGAKGLRIQMEKTLQPSRASLQLIISLDELCA